ncbi:hypothetical protein GSI_10884 [Ganoderma sinense ZZ0214-1]|uniref:Transporter n=1 Tax=Ganoderma sinense ZZ0214-1 TaxID=1077348 RepID=A0A2G8S1V5_9APHY|nr:hypothetical protein GSI_10884 [Ganoderma sinense ZZ0214-1]
MRFSVIVFALALVNFAAAAALPRAEAEESTEIETLVARGKQDIGGLCSGDSECITGCCDFRMGECASHTIASKFGGCGFGGSDSKQKPKPKPKHHRDLRS